MYSFPVLESVCCSMSSSNCCFLTFIQISQEADQVVCYSHLLKNFPQFVVIHTVKGFGRVYKAEVDVFQELCCSFFFWSIRCLQFDLWLTRCQSRRKWAHLLLRELQHDNLVLHNHQQENVGSHQKKIPHVHRQRGSPSKMVGRVKLHLEP